MKIKDSNITINVKDIEKSILFYESIGLTLQQRWDDHYALMAAPGIKIGLHPSNESENQNNSGNISIGFTSENFNATKASLLHIGINYTERKEEGGEFLHFNDPDGIALYFILPKW
jgi:catechol 2,3-dioxygenase-like lactoylglutathione lyase family enzyme